MGKCRNCNADLVGKFCHECGQNSDDYHRNIFLLFWEIIKELFNFDSRIWRTVPTLFFNPGELVHAQISGQIRKFVPPFRLFVISLLIIILSLQTKINDFIEHAQKPQTSMVQNTAAPTNSTIDYEIEGDVGNEIGAMDFSVIGKDFGKFMREGNDKLAGEIAVSKTDVPWLREAIANAVQNPKVYLLSIFEWAQKLSILLLPISTLFLGLMYFWRRDIFLFDHALVALNMISFVFLMTSLCIWLPKPFGGLLYGFSFFLIPLNFYFVFRKGYRSSKIGSFLRSILTASGIFIVFILLILSVMALAGIT